MRTLRAVVVLLFWTALCHADLAHQKVIRHSSDHFSFDKAHLIFRDGIRVLHLRGTAYEMAYQHGMLLKAEILKGAVPQSALLIDHTIDNSFGTNTTMASIAKAYVRRNITRKMIDHNLKEGGSGAGAGQLEIARGLSEATGLKPDVLYEAMFAPDVLMILAADPPLTDLRVAPFSACSDFAVWGPHTESGEMIIGRNLDYPLNGHYDAYPTIIYFEPSERNAQRYIAVTSAGVHNAGLTAINEAGLFVGAHTIPTSDVSKTGLPAFVVVSEIVRQARTFDEAVMGFKNHLPATGYAYTLVSTKEKRAATIEISANHAVVRESSAGFHAQSNHYRTEEMKPHYLHVNASVDDDSEARLARMEELLKGARGHVDARMAMRILGDSVDPFTHKARGHGNTVAVHTTVSSVVVLPEQQKIYVANGMGPASQSVFVELPLFVEWDLEKWLGMDYEAIDNSSFKSEHFNLANALQFFIEAKKTYEYQNDPTKALEWMRKAANTDPNPVYEFMRGILALKSKQENEAREAFTKIASEENRAGLLGRYYLGRMQSDAGEKKGACETYASVWNSPNVDPKLKDAAREACKKTESLKGFKINPNKLRIFMQQGDMVAYE